MAAQKPFPPTGAQHLHVHADSCGDYVHVVHCLPAIVFPVRTTGTASPPEAGVSSATTARRNSRPDLLSRFLRVTIPATNDHKLMAQNCLHRSLMIQSIAAIRLCIFWSMRQSSYELASSIGPIVPIIFFSQSSQPSNLQMTNVLESNISFNDYFSFLLGFSFFPVGPPLRHYLDQMRKQDFTFSLQNIKPDFVKCDKPIRFVQCYSSYYYIK